MISIFLTLLLLMAGSAVVDGSHASEVLLSLKDVDPKVLTNTMTVAAFMQGFLAMEAPKLNLELYGTHDRSLYTKTMSAYLGSGILSIGVICLCVFTQHVDVTRAIGWSLVVPAVLHLRGLLNQVPARSGISPIGLVLWLVHVTNCIHACFTDAPYTTRLLEAGYIVFAVTCILAIFSPKIFAKMYGRKDAAKLTDDELLWTRVCVCFFSLSC